jgi:hypothetical protein
MMEFMVEIVVTAFALGGILGAVIALHLSSNLKPSESSSAQREIPELQQIPVEIHAKNRPSQRRRRIR